MFGLTEKEFNIYTELVRDFSDEYICSETIDTAQFIVGVEVINGERQVDTQQLNETIGIVEHVLQLTTLLMAYDYAHHQTLEEPIKEEEILKKLHLRYETFMIENFIKYGVSFTTDVFEEVLLDVVSELPLLYSSSIEDENFDEQKFLEETIEAYDNYILNNFQSEEEEED